MRGGEKELVEKLGRNDPCPCGSGKAFKRCCLAASRFRRLGARRLLAESEASVVGRSLKGTGQPPKRSSRPDREFETEQFQEAGDGGEVGLSLVLFPVPPPQTQSPVASA